MAAALSGVSHRRSRRAFRSNKLVERNPTVDWNALDDVVYGCANQSGEDNRNVARAWLCFSPACPKKFSGATVNRLCGSSMDAIAVAARGVKSGELDLLIAGGVEKHVPRTVSSSAKSDAAFARKSENSKTPHSAGAL